MDDAKKKISAVGLAASLATSAVISSGLNAGEKEVVSDTSFVREIEDKNSSFDYSKPFLDNIVPETIDNSSKYNVSDINSSEYNVSTINSSEVTSYDIPSDNAFNILSENINVSNNDDKTVNMNNISFTDSPVSNERVNSPVKSDDQKVVDYDCYSLMQDAIGYSFERFNSNYSSLSEALELNYNVKLSDAQKARYDTIMKDTYDAYKRGIAAYESGDLDTFRKICDEVLKDKKYLNLDDFVDILALNINKQGNYIKNSKNYKIEDGKLIIDGITVDGLFSNSKGINPNNAISLISFYDNCRTSDYRTLDIMQVPIFESKEATRPSNFTLVDNGTVYAYDNDFLKKTFDDIYADYSSVTGLDRFHFERTSDGSSILYGYDKNNNKLPVNSVQYASGISYFLTNLQDYRMSENSKVGYFSGTGMKQFLGVFENGIDNVQVPETYSVRVNNEYMNYSLMQDTLTPFYMYDRNHPSLSLSDVLESTYGVELTDAQKERYDTLVKDTYDAYQKGIDAYESGRVSDFRKICDDILINKKYMNFDDLVDIIAININSNAGTNIIKDSSNYSIVNDTLVIDGVEVESLLSNGSSADFMSIVKLYNENCDGDFNVLNIMQVPNYILKQSTNPTSLSLMVNGKVYSYSNDELDKKFNSIYGKYCSILGLSNLGFENALNNQLLLFGYDENNNKQYIDNNNPYSDQVSQFIAISGFKRSQDSRIGYFDGEFLKEYLKQFDSFEMTMSK